MDKIKRVIVNKNDEPTLVAEKVIDAEAETVLLVVPKFSKLASSATNFKLIKREAEVMKKKVLIESVDDSVVMLAKKSGLEATNPFFGKVERRVSDITRRVPRDETASKEVPLKSKIKKEPLVENAASTKLSEIKNPPKIIHRENDSDSIVKISPVRTAAPRSIPSASKSNRRQGSFFRRFIRIRTLIIIIVLAFLAGAIYAGSVVLPRANIIVSLKKQSWQFQNIITADKGAAAIDVAASRIPGQLFTQKSNNTASFPASGKKVVDRRATGKLVIYNALSSAPQTLVASTRFQTQDGKIFRLTSGITIPGAKIESGKIIPSLILTTVTADKPGPAYNIGPVSRLSIPGFQGTPQYVGFYGELKEGTSGGFTGELNVPTEADIKSAKAEVSKRLEQATRLTILSQIPSQFKIVEGASRFLITKQTVGERLDSNKKFPLTTEAQLTIFAFREKDILSLLASRISADPGKEYEIKSQTIQYSPAKLDENTGRLMMPILYHATLAQKVDIQSLIQKIKGESEANLRSTILALPGIEGAKVSFWPFWVKSAPERLDRIQIKID